MLPPDGWRSGGKARHPTELDHPGAHDHQAVFGSRPWLASVAAAVCKEGL